MAIDISIPLRRATIERLVADSDLTEEVPAARIYGQTVHAAPVFPFIRSGAPAPLPLKAACVDGSVTNFAMHVFAKDRIESGVTLELAEDYAGRLGALVAKLLDGAVFALDNGRVRLRWTGSQLLMDPDEASCFHAVVNISARAITG